MVGKVISTIETIIYEQEQTIFELQSFAKENKGNQKMKDEVSKSKLEVEKLRFSLKHLYMVRNSCYGGGKVCI